MAEEVGLNMVLCSGCGFENYISVGIDGPVSSLRADLWRLWFMELMS